MWLCLDISRYVLKEYIHALRTLLTPFRPLFQRETELAYLSIYANFDYPTNDTYSNCSYHKVEKIIFLIFLFTKLSYFWQDKAYGYV